jgi:hypothetical protein
MIETGQNADETNEQSSYFKLVFDQYYVYRWILHMHGADSLNDS